MRILVREIGEIDAHRNALHHLHVIACGIFRRKQRQNRTGGAANLRHAAFVVPARRIDMNLHGLQGLHVLELGLLEVRRHPNILERNQGEQILPRRNVLIDLNALARDDAVGRRHDSGVAQVEFSLIELGLCLFHLRLGLFSAGTLRSHLLRTGLRVLLCRLRLLLLLAGHLHCVSGSLFAGKRVVQRGFGGVGGVHSRVKLLLADHVFLNQRLVALQVGLRFGEVGVGLGHACLRSLELLFRLFHPGVRARYVGVCGAQITAGIDGDNRDVDIGRICVGHGAGQRGFGVLYRNFVIAGVQLGYGRARMHELVLRHIHLEHLTADARAHLDEMAIHLRVVGILAVGGVPPHA